MFYDVRDELEKQFENPKYIYGSGLTRNELQRMSEEYTNSDMPLPLARAKTIELVLTKGRIGIDERDIFQDKIDASGVLWNQNYEWHRRVVEGYFADEEKYFEDARGVGAGTSGADYGHLTPDTLALCELGLTGIVERLRRERDARTELSEAQSVFYDSTEIAWLSVISFARRLSRAIRPYNEKNADCLEAIASGKPKTTYEAMQLIWLYFAVHEIISGERVRTLGRLDVILFPFYKSDLESGTTEEELRELMRYFLFKMWSAKIPFDLPLTIGGEDPDGKADVTNAVSYMLVDIYDELGIHSPKIHVRISDKTPKDFIEKILDCIRRGNSSFLMMNDSIAVKGLMKVGIEERDARNYVPVGCYENGAWGVEMPCTGNSSIVMPKAIEYTVTGGLDFASGKRMSVKTPEPGSFREMCDTVKTHLAYMLDRTADYICGIEKRYPEAHCDPFTSGLCEYAVKEGADVFCGSAKYNNSSVNYMGLATLVDSLAAVKVIVYDEKRLTLHELFDALRANWKGYEPIRRHILSLADKYGNRSELCDSLISEFTNYIAKITNGRPNGRGGVFKAGCFSINHCFKYGKAIMATPDGRLASEPFSKNLCAVDGMDKSGITAYMTSAAKIDHTLFSNGTVLDYILHPSAVSGTDGLCAMYGLVMTYFRLGGLALHGNVFNSDVLRDAVANPEKHKNLQVRLCGWNTFFVRLSPEEQESFIVQAQGRM